jgi:hypothetical protein
MRFHLHRTHAGNVNAQIEGECKNPSDRDQKCAHANTQNAPLGDSLSPTSYAKVRG